MIQTEQPSADGLEAVEKTDVTATAVAPHQHLPVRGAQPSSLRVMPHSLFSP